MRLLPVAILDGRGLDVTPAGLAWSVERTTAGTFLRLDLDDSSLPTPYVIDPTLVGGAWSVLEIKKGTTITITKPAGLATGNVMVAHVTTRDTGGYTTVPAGWTLVTSQPLPNSGGESGVWYKVATASEPASYTWGWAGQNDAVGAVGAYSGTWTAAGPIEWQAGASTTGTSNAPGGGSLDTTLNNDMLLLLVGAGSNANVSTTPAGMTNRYDLTSSSGAPSVRASGQGFDQQLTTAATGITRSYTMTGTADWAATLLAIKPAVTAVSAANSTVSASPASVVADGTTASTVTVTLRDTNSNPVAGKTVTLSKSGGSSRDRDRQRHDERGGPGDLHGHGHRRRVDHLYRARRDGCAQRDADGGRRLRHRHVREHDAPFDQRHAAGRRGAHPRRRKLDADAHVDDLPVAPVRRRRRQLRRHRRRDRHLLHARRRRPGQDDPRRRDRGQDELHERRLHVGRRLGRGRGQLLDDDGGLDQRHRPGRTDPHPRRRHLQPGAERTRLPVAPLRRRRRQLRRHRRRDRHQLRARRRRPGRDVRVVETVTLAGYTNGGSTSPRARPSPRARSRPPPPSRQRHRPGRTDPHPRRRHLLTRRRHAELPVAAVRRGRRQLHRHRRRHRHHLHAGRRRPGQDDPPRRDDHPRRLQHRHLHLRRRPRPSPPARSRPPPPPRPPAPPRSDRPSPASPAPTTPPERTPPTSGASATPPAPTAPTSPAPPAPPTPSRRRPGRDDPPRRDRHPRRLHQQQPPPPASRRQSRPGRSRPAPGCRSAARPRSASP